MPSGRKACPANARAIFAAGTGAFVAAGGITADDKGVKTQRFVKDLITAGTWYKGNQAHDVPVERLNHWADTFAAMSKAGVKVPLPLGHTNDADKNRGYVADMFVRDNADGKPTLYMAADLIGEDAIALANRVEVSINAEPELKAGDGKTFSDCLTHVALVTDPVVNGQGPFVKLAASRGGGTVEVPVFRMSQESNMDWKALATALGLDPTVLDDKTWFAACLAAAQADATETPEPAMAAARAELKTATDALAAARSEIAALKAGKAPEVDPDVLDDAADTTASKIDLRLSRIGKAACDKLKTMLCGTPDARPSLALSRKAAKAAGLPDTLANQVLDVIDAITPCPKTGPQSGPQTFSRQVPGEGPAREDKDIDARAKGAYGR